MRIKKDNKQPAIWAQPNTAMAEALYAAFTENKKDKQKKVKKEKDGPNGKPILTIKV